MRLQPTTRLESLVPFFHQPSIRSTFLIRASLSSATSHFVFSCAASDDVFASRFPVSPPADQAIDKCPWRRPNLHRSSAARRQGDWHPVPYPIPKGSQPLAGGYAKRYHRMTGEIKATRSRRDRSTFALASLRDATGSVRARVRWWRCADHRLIAETPAGLVSELTDPR
jgi:hypothetical protein